MGKKKKQEKQPLTVYDHIRELRMRILSSLFALLISGLMIYAFYGQILTFLCSPLGSPLYYNNPAGSFSFVMKICFTGALIVAIPVIIYNIIMFVRPAFLEYLPKKRVYKISLASTILATSGAAFAFFCVLPGTLAFFKGFQVEGLKALISADNYLNFITNIIIMFVLVFQIPLIILFIDLIKPITPARLFKNEKWIILGSLIFALIAPFTYDLLTSLLITAPIIILYNLSIFAVLYRHAKIQKEKHRAFCANISKSSENSVLSTANLSFEGIADEIISEEKTNPVVTNTNQQPAMDIMPIIIQSKQTVQPADWVIERKRRQMELNKKVKVFSDIRREPKINHVLASQ